MTSINEIFENAVHEVNHAEWGNKIPNERKLKCYAYYKQATIGDVDIEQPWVFRTVERAKWEAWNSAKGITRENAKKLYVEEWERQKRDFSYLKNKQ